MQPTMFPELRSPDVPRYRHSPLPPAPATTAGSSTAPPWRFGCATRPGAECRATYVDNSLLALGRAVYSPRGRRDARRASAAGSTGEPVHLAFSAAKVPMRDGADDPIEYGWR